MDKKYEIVLRRRVLSPNYIGYVGDIFIHENGEVKTVLSLRTSVSGYLELWQYLTKFFPGLVWTVLDCGRKRCPIRCWVIRKERIFELGSALNVVTEKMEIYLDEVQVLDVDEVKVLDGDIKFVVENGD